MRAASGHWARLLHVALLVVLAWQLFALVSVAVSRPLEFDGGMNLEVAKSIAQGEGPRGQYQHAQFYPPGVQSKEPFYLVGAAVFKVAGIGPVQAHMTNVVFLLALVALIVCVVTRAVHLTAGLLAAIFVLATPRMTFYGMSGYGEIATMVFGLGALTVIAWPRRFDVLGWRAFFAGVLAGLAVATKVVGVVQFAAIAGVLALRVLSDSDSRVWLRALVRTGVTFAAGVLVPLLLVELWRLHWLGLEGYRAWWDFQLLSIGSQSGAVPSSQQNGWQAKIPAHFAVLAGEIQRKPLATAALLALPLLSAVLVAWRQFPRPAPQDAPRTWLSLGLFLIAALYIPWWLAIVPDDKAWVRYLYVALLALAILAAMGIALHLRRVLQQERPPLSRAVHAVVAIGLALVFVPFAWRSLPKQRVDFSPGIEVQAMTHAARLVDSLPKDRPVFGYGWYAAPVIRMHTDREFLDLTDWPIGRLTGKPGYLVADRQTYTVGVIAPILAQYPHRKLMRDNGHAQVYELDFAHPFDPFKGKDTSAVRTAVDFAEVDYPLVRNYEPYQPIGGRQAWSDSEVLLRYEGQPELRFAAYMGLPRFYVMDEPLRGRVVIDGCRAQPFAFDASGWREFRIPVTCALPKDANVRVRILLDNVFNLPWEKLRQQGMLVRKIGFAG